MSEQSRGDQPEQQPGQQPWPPPHDTQQQSGPPQGQPYGAPQGQPYGTPPSSSWGPPQGGTAAGGDPYGRPSATGPRPEGADDLSPTDQRLWATLTHVGGIVVPVVGPLVLFLVLKDRGLFVRDQVREALNFHISLGLYFVAAYIGLGILAVVTFGLAAPLLGLPPLLWFPLVVLGVIAAVRSNRGERHRYPLTVRLVR